MGKRKNEYDTFLSKKAEGKRDICRWKGDSFFIEVETTRIFWINILKKRILKKI